MAGSSTRDKDIASGSDVRHSANLVVPRQCSAPVHVECCVTSTETVGTPVQVDLYHIDTTRPPPA